MTRLDASAATGVLGWLGIPALPHGNVIQVATGTVGIDEACSGIRSFQATLMISLFLGEFYRLSALRRSILCLSGFALSVLFNLARMTLLVWIAARHGVEAIATWHDPAGVTILLACFFGLWAVGGALGKAEKRKTNQATAVALEGPIGCPQVSGFKSQVSDLPSPVSGLQSPSSALQAPDSRPQAPSSALPSPISDSPSPSPLPAPRSPLPAFGFPVSGLSTSALSLFFWLLLTEVSIESWYRWHEARLPRATQWTLAFPTNNPTLKELPLEGRARQILRYDEGHRAAWDDEYGDWQAVFLRWNPGGIALHLAQSHTPEVCMTAAGHTLTVVARQHWLDVGAPVSDPAGPATPGTSDENRTGVRRPPASTHSLRLPFAIYEVTDASRLYYVFYCLWDDRANLQGFQRKSLSFSARLAPVLEGRRNPGQRSLEIAVVGPDTPAVAEAALRAELEKVVQLN